MNRSKGPAGRRRSSASPKNNIRINSSLADRRKAKKHSRAAAKAEYLSTLPKEPWKRVLHRLHPKRVAAYWFSREGGIMALKLVGVGIVVCFFLTVGLFAYFRKDLPKIKDISGGNLGGSITYYDRTGQTVLWQDYDSVKRIPVQSDQISPYLKNATIAVENKDFYNQGAFDVRGIARAGYNDVFNRSGGLQGGSTITQQLVKLNEDWTNDRTISRKVKELILAVEMEREYSKSEILTGYLNMAPYGGLEYGAEAAARDYFQTSAKDLTLPQASMLAAIPKSPSRLSPYSSVKFNKDAGDKFDQEGLIARQHYILDQMADQGYITRAQATEAKQVDVLAQVKPLTNKYNDIKAPFFVLAAKKELQEKYGEKVVDRGGWKVITTLNMDLQTTAENLVTKNMPNVKRNGGDTSAFVASDVKTGQMVALVGGPNFKDPNLSFREINYAQINLSPGSSFKPYDYATFIDNRSDAGASSVLYDVQQPLGTFKCTDKNRDAEGDAKCLFDYDNKYPGAVTLRYALGGSRNVPAVKAMLSAIPNDKSQDRVKSINKVISTANSMMGNSNAYKCFQRKVTDIQTADKSDQAQCFGSSAIGDGAYLHLDEHVNGLATLARNGNALPQTYILNITDSGNKTIYKWTQPKGKQVIKPDSAFIVNDILSDPKASYMRQQYKVHDFGGWKTAYKTGTTANNYDGLMGGWNTQYAAVSWVGYHTRTQALKGSMESMTAPLTQEWMKQALTKLNTKPVNWEKPNNIKFINGYVQRNHVGNFSIEPGPTQDYFPSWYQQKAGSNTRATIDRVSGGLATSCTPAAARQTVGGANDNTFSADEFWPIGKTSGSTSTTSTTAANDSVHSCDDAKPTVTINTPPAVCSASDNGGQGCLITAVVSAGTHPLSGSSFGGTATLSSNGTVVSTQNLGGSPSTVSFYFKPSASGTASITINATDSVLYEASQTVTVNAVTGPTAQAYPAQNATLTSTNNRRQDTSGGSGNGNNSRQQLRQQLREQQRDR